VQIKFQSEKQLSAVFKI